MPSETESVLGESTGGVFWQVRAIYKRFARLIGRRMPRGLFPRSLIIIITPMVLLQSVVAYIFMERHWEAVTARLSQSLARDIAAVVKLVEMKPGAIEYDDVVQLALDAMDLTVMVRPSERLPTPHPSGLFSMPDTVLHREISRRIEQTFWLEKIGESKIIEARVQVADRTVYVFARRSRAYISNSHIFIVWMVVASIVLLFVAILFLRNQIRPIQRLADAAEGFGKGKPIGDFQPRGAREVRQAAEAFVEMRKRIERQISQRTAMLSGVSHDLRTILTRFQLQLALMEKSHETDELRDDVAEMLSMLDSYLAFAKGDAGEARSDVNVHGLIESLADDLRHGELAISIAVTGDPTGSVKPNALRRCLRNLLNNAARFAHHIDIEVTHQDGLLQIIVDDDGPGIPADERENVFRPFYRLDSARNQDSSGTGLGMAIARDIVLSHGGTISLADSQSGGLRVKISLPA